MPTKKEIRDEINSIIHRVNTVKDNINAELQEPARTVVRSGTKYTIRTVKHVQPADSAAKQAIDNLEELKGLIPRFKIKPVTSPRDSAGASAGATASRKGGSRKKRGTKRKGRK